MRCGVISAWFALRFAENWLIQAPERAAVQLGSGRCRGPERAAVQLGAAAAGPRSARVSWVASGGPLGGCGSGIELARIGARLRPGTADVPDRCVRCCGCSGAFVSVPCCGAGSPPARPQSRLPRCAAGLAGARACWSGLGVRCGDGWGDFSVSLVRLRGPSTGRERLAQGTATISASLDRLTPTSGEPGGQEASRAGWTISRYSSRTAAVVGMAITAPITPNSMPPMMAESTTRAPGTFTVRFITLG